MTTKHTPGPWFTWEGGVYSGRPKVMKRRELSGYDAKICAIDDLYGTARSRKANARLIAAAPELLAALQDVDALWMHHSIAHGDGKISPLHEKVISAIAKATGEHP